MKKYLVIDAHWDGDTYEKAFDTLEEANAAAKADWEHLTKFEQVDSWIHVGSVTEDDLDLDLIDTEEEGWKDNPKNWTLVKRWDDPAGAFDSGDPERLFVADNPDIYGGMPARLISLDELTRLASEWEMPLEELASQCHPATEEDVAKYGDVDE